MLALLLTLANARIGQIGLVGIPPDGTVPANALMLNDEYLIYENQYLVLNG